MPSYKIISYNQEAMIANCNGAKDTVIKQLLKEGTITQEEALEWLRNRSIIIDNPSNFSYWWKKIWPSRKNEDGKRFIIIKQMNMEEPKILEEKKEK